jgi:hypothetical protein
MEDTMSVKKLVVVTGLLVAALAGEASAQDQAIGFKIRGGSMHGISHLNDAHTADLQQRGGNVGAGIQLDVSKYVAFRGDVDFNRNELKVNEIDTGNDLSRLFYDASIQIQYPVKNFTPYIFVGAGAVTLHPVGTNDADQTKFAGTGGLGVSYTVPGTQLALGLEGKSWLYQLEGLGGFMNGYDKMQYDATWNAAISYRIPFGNATRTATR